MGLLMTAKPTSARIALAFLAIYSIWGSTYLGIKLAIDTLPPLLMAGTRFLLAGTLLYIWIWRTGRAKPTAQNWLGAAIVGCLMLFVGNGTVSWAELRIPSGMTSLLITTNPIWMALFDWAYGGPKPSMRLVSLMLLGFAGVVLLVNPGQIAGSKSLDLVAAAAVTLSSISWAWGSMISRTAQLPSSPMLSAALQMLCGGAMLMLLGFAVGEHQNLNLASVSARSIFALLYLAIFGSIVALSSYVWLLRVTSASKVATCAYVNPIVAVFLGWCLGGEEITSQTVLATVIILASVFLIVSDAPKPQGPAPLDQDCHPAKS
jgi:drug/metabolite transporter (DMT)-like permease